MTVGIAISPIAAFVISIGMVMSHQALAESDNAWYVAGQAELKAKIARTPITGNAKNVILFIGDGNGVSTNYATRVFQGQQKGGYGEENVMAKESMPYLALSKTYTTNAQTPDSAGTAVAILSGVKSKSGVIGVDETLRRSECADVAGAKVESIGDVANSLGKSIGIVTTSRITHATPAALYASVADRNFEADIDLPEDCKVSDIAAQAFDKIIAGSLDFVMGGGRQNFLPSSVKDEEGKTGRRADNRNMVAEAKAAGVQYAWNEDTFESLELDKPVPVLGLFESSHMQFEYDRKDEPSIVAMTEAAIRYLSANKEGYFLLVEGGRIDHANHNGNAFRAITDGVVFDDAVAKAIEMTDTEDTLIVVTADHGHAMTFNGYCGRGTPIEGLCYKIDQTGEMHLEKAELASDGKPYTTIGYLNGSGSVLTNTSGWGLIKDRTLLDQKTAINPDFVQQSMLPLGSETHSPVDVAIYAQGPWAHLFDGTVEENYIFHVMRHAFGAD